MPHKPRDFDGFPDALAAEAPFGPYRGIVQDITDGDTFSVLIDHGLNAYTVESIRIADIDAPELFSGTNRAAGAAARNYLAALIPPGSPVVLHTRKDRQSFTRYVADVTADSLDGAVFDVGQAMVDGGHAVKVNGEGHQP